MLDEKGVQRGEHQGKREDPEVKKKILGFCSKKDTNAQPEMKDESDDWTSLHVVNSFFCQPVKGFEEEKQGEQSHKLGREVIPGDISQN